MPVCVGLTPTSIKWLLNMNKCSLGYYNQYVMMHCKSYYLVHYLQNKPVLLRGISSLQLKMGIKVVISIIYIKIGIDMLRQKQDKEYASLINDLAAVVSSLITV